MVLSSTNVIIAKHDRVWPRNATITNYRPTHGTVRRGHKVGIIQVYTVQYNVYLKFLFFNVN